MFRNKLMRPIVFVADSASEGLIDTDFLRAQRMIIDFAANKVTREEILSLLCARKVPIQLVESQCQTAVVLAGTSTISEGRTRKPLVSRSWII